MKLRFKALTTGTDKFTGDTGDDTFDGSLNSIGNQTYVATDYVDGGAGNDTFSVAFSAAGAGTYVPSTLKNIENVSIYAAGAMTLNLTNATGLTSVTNAGSGATVNVKNIDASSAAVTISNTTAGSTVEYKSNTLSGATDSATINLQGAGSTLTVQDVDNSISDAYGVETLNLVTSNTGSTITTLTTTNLGTTSLVISGDQNLTVTTFTDATSTGVTLKTIDASALTGSLSITGAHNTASAAGNTITGGSGNDSLTGGAGNDVISAGDGNDTITLGTGDDSISAGAGNDTVNIAGNHAATDTLDGGDGTDILRASAALVSSTTAAGRVTNFETVQADVAATAVGATNLSQDLTYYTGITGGRIASVSYADDNDATADAATSAVAFSGVGASFATLTLAGGGITATGSDDDLGTFAVTASVARLSDTTADSLNLVVGSGTSAAVGSTSAGAITLNLTASDEETLTLTSAGAANAVGTLTVSDLKTLNVAATAAITVTTLINNGSTFTKLDASSSTADVTFTTQALSSAGTVIGGSGDDLLTGSTGADTISGGSGNDVLAGNGGADTISGDAGDDSVTGGSGADVLSGGDGNDTITGSTGNDSITGGAGNDRIVFTLADAATSAITGADTNDTIAGGDGTDYIRLNQILLAQDSALDLSSSTLTTFTNLSGVEGIQLNVDSSVNGTVRALTLTLGDTVLDNFGDSLTITAGSTYDDIALTVNASAITDGAAKVTVTLGTTTNTTGELLTYTVGANIDNVTAATDLADVFNVTTATYLSSTDTLNGSSGTDVLTFNTNAAATITASQMSGVSSVESILVDNGTTATAAAKITLSQAVAAANAAAATNALTVSREATETGTLNVDGSAVTSVNLLLSGAAGADTLTGGSYNDTLAGGTGIDSLTGGAGDDMFRYAATTAISTTEAIVGGTGTDTIQITAAITTGTADFTSATLSSIEALDGLGSGATAKFLSSQLSSTTAITESATTATDTIFNVVANSTTVDVSGFTYDSNRTAGTTITNDGSYSAFAVSITGSTGIDLITGGANADTITGGLGADNIAGGAGADIISLAESTASSDTITFSSAATNGIDSIIGFTVGTGGDVFEISTVDADLNATIKSATISAAGALTSLGNTATAADVDVLILLDITLAGSAGALTEIDVSAGAVTDTDGAIIVFYNATTAAVEVWHNANESDGLGAMTQIATLTGLTSSDVALLVATNFA